MMMLLWVCLKRQTIISAFIILSEAFENPSFCLQHPQCYSQLLLCWFTLDVFHSFAWELTARE